MRKVVVDTNILVSALWSKQGNPFHILEMVFENILTIYFTIEMIEEYESVLCREKFGFQRSRVNNLLQELLKNGILVESIAGADVFFDETNRKFYDTAKANDATLITGNIKHYPDDPLVMTPFEFIKLILDN